MLSLGKDKKLSSKKEYQQVFAARKTIYGKYFQLVYCLNSTQKNSRLGLGIAKKHHKLAVQRNILKRIAREVFRTNSIHNYQQNFDVIVLSKFCKEVVNKTNLRNDLQLLFGKLK